MRRFFEAAFAPGGQTEYVGKNVHIGSYSVTVDSVLAEGGFAMVYLVNAKLANAKSSKAALKRMFVNDTETLEGCKREINIMKELSGHKNIVRYMAHKVTRLPTGIYEVLVLLEYCSRGHVLDQMNKRLNSGFSEDEVLHIFCDVVEAIGRLHHAHPAIAHRDLKVENVLIHDSNRYVLCDFGSASQAQLEPDKIGVPIVEEEITKFTTVQYRAPEMVDLYSGYPIGIKADIWALGVLLYHLCFFNLPFSTTLSIQTGEVAVPDNSPFSRELHQIIQFCLNINPEIRPDIWQLAHVTFKYAQRSNPVQNSQNSPPIELSSILPLRSATQLAEHKANQRKLQHDRNNANNNLSTSIAPRQRPQGGTAASSAPKKSINTPTKPTDVINKADHALHILQQQMAEIKLQYDRLDAAPNSSLTSEIHAQKKQLEEHAGTIKMKYQKILELRNENQAKIAVQNAPVPSGTFQTHPECSGNGQSDTVYSKPPPNAMTVAGGDIQSHRRAVSDPSAIIEYQQAQMSNSRTIASGLSNSRSNPLPDEFGTGSFSGANPLSVNFGSDSTIDSVHTVRYAGSLREIDKHDNDEDQAFDEFLAERKNTQENINFNCDDGPNYVSLENSNNIDTENITNGGWVNSPNDSSSSSSSDSSVDFSENGDCNEIGIEQLINSSDDEAIGKQTRSLTCPDIYANNLAESSTKPNGTSQPLDDPFMMAPFPAASFNQSNYERDPFNAAPFQGRSVSKNNPFRSINEGNDPFQSAPFHV